MEPGRDHFSDIRRARIGEVWRCIKALGGGWKVMIKCRFYVLAIAFFLGAHETGALAQDTVERCSDRAAYSAQERIAACNDLLEHSANDFSQRVAALYNLGIAKYDNKDLIGSIQSFSAAIQTDPAYPPAFVNRGIAERDLSQFDLAVQDYNRAIALDPSAPRAYGNRANVYFLLKKYGPALEDYNHALTLDPSNERTRTMAPREALYQAALNRLEGSLLTFPTATCASSGSTRGMVCRLPNVA